ncbi:unnamed protein product, partial [marine sediment metagenome]
LETQAGELKIKPDQLAQKNKRKVSLSEWAMYILLGLLGLNEAIQALTNEGRADDASQLQGLLGV